MPYIMAVNPKKKKKPRKTRKPTKAKGGPTMAKKRKRKTTRKYKRNPSRAGALARRGGRRVATYSRGLVAGVNMTTALRSTVPLLLGALAAKFTAKKFADGGAENDNWTWKNYAFGILGTLVSAFAVQALFRAKQGTATKVMEGGLLLVAYKVFCNEVAPMNDTLEEWFAGDDDDAAYPEMEGYGGLGEEMGPEDFTPGDIWQGDDEDYVMGGDGYWRPLDESHREPAMMGMGGIVEPATPGMGGIVEPATPGMGSEGDFDYRW